MICYFIFFFKQKTAYEMRISDWSDVCSSDLAGNLRNKRSRIVGVSICNLVNPYFADVTAGLQEALEDLGRVLVLGNCAESVERQLNFLQTLRQYRVEGVDRKSAV